MWIILRLKIFEISGKIIDFTPNAMEKWREKQITEDHKPSRESFFSETHHTIVIRYWNYYLLTNLLEIIIEQHVLGITVKGIMIMDEAKEIAKNGKKK